MNEPRSIAAVITEWRTNSHADVLLGRLLEPGAWGHKGPLGLKLASVYADQFPANDLCRSYCERHGVPIYPTVRGAIGLGTGETKVDGVLLVGEHGDYPRNGRDQRLYPRRRLFEDVVNAFRVLGRRVPVFNDKHLSYDPLLARWMVDLARHEGIPLMAGSSLPVAWRVPGVAPPMGAEIEGALAIGYGDVEAYGFHALEMLQSFVERRPGGETGVAAVRCLTGEDVWKRLAPESRDGATLRALSALAIAGDPAIRRPEPRPRDVLFEIRYVDGLTAIVPMLGSVGECFAVSCRVSGRDEPVAALFALENRRPFGHFGHLLRAFEAMVRTGRSSYPVERTLLTGGMIASLLQSRAEGGPWVDTPYLAELAYTSADWPFAPGPPHTPA